MNNRKLKLSLNDNFILIVSDAKHGVCTIKNFNEFTPTYDGTGRLQFYVYKVRPSAILDYRLCIYTSKHNHK